MAHRLRMPGQLGDWLAELGGSAPLAAAEAGAAIVALLAAPQPHDLTLVTDPDSPDAGDDPRELLDGTYQDLLGRLQLVRGYTGDARTTRKNVEARLKAAQEAGEIAGIEPLTRLLERAQAREQELTDGSEALRREADAFGANKTAVLALYTAAGAFRQIEESTTAGFVRPLGLGSSSGELAAAAADRTRVLLGQARRLRQDIRSFFRAAPGTGPAVSRASAGPPAGGSAESGAGPGWPPVLELRADPLGADIRILFAAEPADTRTLLTALEGADVARQNRDTAIELAGELLAEIRAGGTPADRQADDSGPDDADGWLEFAEPAAFLAKYFPGSESAIQERAGALAAAISLAGLRRQRGLSLAGLAAASGLDEKLLRATENGDLRAASLQEVAVYVRALGGSLDLAARVGGGHFPLA
jgi:hypothetical protein